MTNTATSTVANTNATAATTVISRLRKIVHFWQQKLATHQTLAHNILTLLARFSIAAVFWKSGQTKVEGFVVDLIAGDFHLGWPHLSDSAIALFKDEYRLPLIAPSIAAHAAAFCEHFFPALLLVGLGTRFAALALLGMTLTIQLLVYPDAYPTHGTWATVLLLLVLQGPGQWSIDDRLARHFRQD